MPGLLTMEETAATVVPAPAPVEEETLGFVVSHQKLELEIDFTTQSITGRTEITILPQRRDLRVLRFNAQQCEIVANSVTINTKAALFEYENAYAKLDINERVTWTASQHEMQKEKIAPMLSTKPVLGELNINIPRSLRIEEVNPFSENAPSAVRDRVVGAVAIRPASTPMLTPRPGDDSLLRFAPLVVSMRFVGVEEGDHRYPHVYTRHSMYPGTASCIFPCIDDPQMRNTWEVAIKCGRTLGDALRRPVQKSNGIPGHKHTHSKHHGHEAAVELSADDKQLEMTVVCSADQTNEVTDPTDNTKKIVSFLCDNQVAPHHIGFAIGPFEQVDLSEFRVGTEDDKLGQKAVQVVGYCLPRRSEEVKNVCQTLPTAVDWFSLTFGSYPFVDYKVCFVDDQIPDTEPLASLSLCSNRMLHDYTIIDPEIDVMRKLTHALASQWIGVSIVALSRADMWVVVGVSYFITELFMKHLCGNNEYRFRMKTLADKLVEVDMQRPTLYSLGEILHLGSFEMDFMILKAPLVLFILDRRLMKFSGSTGLTRIISKLFINASTGEQLIDKTVSTEGFRKICEKVGHYKLDAFFSQWVLGSGCPRFQIVQKFNKKRLAVEMMISQKQDTMPTQRKLEKEGFMREFKEETNGIYAGEVQSVFTGPMTIRIHEADGTPYEHIVEIREKDQKFEIPYHTKYKRLKRSRREKERATAGPGVTITAENQDDVLLYCLGDVLQAQEEVKEWGLVDWDPEIEQRMDQESYEWIRMDADFEWICEMGINMPAYMYVSQLQQDRDVVAQQDSLLYLGKATAHPLVSTFLTRTLMDGRYFHGIRTMAADLLAKHATEGTNWVGLKHLEMAFRTFFCQNGSQSMARSNDFSNKVSYLIQCAIPRSMARIRDNADKCPREARQFILDQLSFNDNHNNEFSDHFYIANLMKAVTQSLMPAKPAVDGTIGMNFGGDDDEDIIAFQQKAIEEIDRYRRMDEWDPSFQNIYTITALECKQRLMKAKIIPVNAPEFFIYASEGSLDLVRAKAIEAVVELGFFTAGVFPKFLLTTMSTNSSPFFRERLFQIFGIALAGVAFGEHKLEAPKQVADDGLMIEDEDANMEAKKAYIARTTSIEGALAALKSELEDNKVLKEALSSAVASRSIGVVEQSDLLDICNVFYEYVESLIVRLAYPRYWTVKHLGKVCIQYDSFLNQYSSILDKPLIT